jgi:hypothetical protein
MNPVDQLREWGYEVREITDCHFRISIFDFWIGWNGCKWWNRQSGERGNKPPDQLAHFIRRRIEYKETEHV